MDTRAQWDEEKLIIQELLGGDSAAESAISALRLPKVGKAGVAAVAETRNPLEVLGAELSESHPVQEPESHDREIVCGFCACRLLPTGRRAVRNVRW